VKTYAALSLSGYNAALLNQTNKKLRYRMEIVPNVHVIPSLTANPFLLIDHDGLTLIDTDIPGSAPRILRYIKRLGYAFRDLKRILLTHADYDHAGSAAALKKATGARLYASLFEASAVATGQFPRSLKTDNIFVKPIFALAERLGRIHPAHVDEHLSEGQVLPVLHGLRVVDTQGHTPGHLSFFAPSLRILFSGDSIVSEKNQLVGSHAPVTWDQAIADEAVKKQLALKARIICVGHGPVMKTDLLGLFFPQIKFAMVPITRYR
jgi:glyoxylase-like metal-dependent hydrolase (beta-lactamase superfamily II)